MKTKYKVTYSETDYGMQYGIVCEQNGRPYRVISEISPDKQVVEDLADRLNNGHLSANQFEDAVEDSLI